MTEARTYHVLVLYDMDPRHERVNQKDQVSWKTNI